MENQTEAVVEEEEGALKLGEHDLVVEFKVQDDVEVDCRAMDWSPDGKRICVPGLGNKVLILDAKTGSKVHELAGHEAKVTGCAWSPTGKWVASVGMDERLLVFSTGTWKQTRERRLGEGFGHKKRVCVENKKRPLKLPPLIAWSPDSSHVAAAGYDERVFIWKGHSFGLRALLKGHKDVISGLGWSSDALKLATGSMDGMVLVWDVDTWKRRVNFSAEQLGVGLVMCISWCVTGDVLAVTGYDGNGNAAVLCNGDSGTVLRKLEGVKYRVCACTWGPAGEWLATTGGDYKVHVWDAEDGSLQLALGGHESWVNCVSMSPTGKQLLTISQDRTLIMWKLQRKEITVALEDISSTKQKNVELETLTIDLTRRIGMLESELRLVHDEHTSLKSSYEAFKKAAAEAAAASPRYIRKGEKKTQSPRPASSSPSPARTPVSTPSEGSVTPPPLRNTETVTISEPVPSTEGPRPLKQLVKMLSPRTPAASVSAATPQPTTSDSPKSPTAAAIPTVATTPTPRGRLSTGPPELGAMEEQDHSVAEQAQGGVRDVMEDSQGSIAEEEIAAILEHQIAETAKLNAELDAARRDHAELLENSHARERELLAELDRLRAAQAKQVQADAKAVQKVAPLSDRAVEDEADDEAAPSGCLSFLFSSSKRQSKRKQVAPGSDGR